LIEEEEEEEEKELYRNRPRQFVVLDEN